MEQPVAPSSAKGRNISPMKIVLVALVVVILVLVALVAMYMAQAEDFRASKYRAQFVVVEDITIAIPLANTAIDELLDDALDNGWRRSAAQYALGTVQRISADCYAIEVMYPEGKDQNATFGALRMAFDDLSETLEDAYDQLSTPDTVPGERDVTSEVQGKLENATTVITQIRAYVLAGIEPGVDWVDAPYDLLAGMDLDALGAAATQLAESQ